ncbi:unnamed protein product [Ilex paraguariensis]|uniref:WIYLD domain-containing protein n=1 Tax=Ilex paraguariensis TaxID=185542 RepID=A0ABC8R3G6_9AQUA
MLAPSPKVTKACQAMKQYGIHHMTVKTVLKDLLNVYDHNWKLIEDKIYAAPLDAIFEQKDRNVKREATKKHGPRFTSAPARMHCREVALVSQTSCKRKVAESSHVFPGDKKTETRIGSPLKYYESKRKKSCSPT